MEDAFVLETLQNAVKAAVTAANTVITQDRIKFEGRTLVPPNDQKYLELVFIPNNRQGDFWGDEKNYRGMFRMILHWPNDDAGPYTPMNVLKAICAYFPNGRNFNGVQIYGAPDFMGKLEPGNETLYPASLLYTFFHQGN
jgi:hypothetical protein